MVYKSVVAGLLLLVLGSEPDPTTRKALDSIQASELKGDLSFLASDLLKGRYTPSPGLEMAAEFIASRFREIGLEPGGGPGFFQVADMVDRKLPRVITPLMGHDGKTPITVEPSKIVVVRSSAAAEIADAPVIKITEQTMQDSVRLKLEGSVALVSDEAYRQRDFKDLLTASKPLLVVVVSKFLPRHETWSLLFAQAAHASTPPVLRVESSELAAALQTNSKLTISVAIPPSEDRDVTVKNVVGVLPGSDPELKSTCVLLTAHYDHIGTTETAADLALSKAVGGDKVYNGANDDGSGTVSVIAVARALAQLHPKRSIVFVTFFGEERGLLGSTYYSLHPFFPIENTIADINLEQLGRTDSSEGPELNNATVTGFDYSEVTSFLEDAGKATGIKVYKDDSASDDFFARSDNASLADKGVPSHTVAVAIEYPDYHAVGDEWQKIDYDNMARVDRMVALAVFNLANARKPPHWNEYNPHTEAFRESRHP